MKLADFSARLGHFAVVCFPGQLCGFKRQHHGGGLGVGPVGTQGLHHGGQYQALHVGTRRVVRAQGVALGGVEGALQQRAKDGGLYLAPVGAGGDDELVDLLLIQ